MGGVLQEEILRRRLVLKFSSRIILYKQTHILKSQSIDPIQVINEEATRELSSCAETKTAFYVLPIHFFRLKFIVFGIVWVIIPGWFHTRREERVRVFDVLSLVSLALVRLLVFFDRLLRSLLASASPSCGISCQNVSYRTLSLLPTNP